MRLNLGRALLRCGGRPPSFHTKGREMSKDPLIAKIIELIQEAEVDAYSVVITRPAQKDGALETMLIKAGGINTDSHSHSCPDCFSMMVEGIAQQGVWALQTHSQVKARGHGKTH